MKQILKYIVFFLLLFLFSCITNKNTRLLQEGSDIPLYEQSSYKDYKLKINDELNVRIMSLNQQIVSAFNLESQTYRIYPDGTIDIPFADSIPVVGLTIEEARTKIEDRLKNVTNDVQVKVGLANNYFYMLGKSGAGESQIYKERLTIYQAIALCKFAPNNGDLKDVKIIRQQDDGTPVIVEFDLRSKSIIGSDYYYVQPNDVIYIGISKGNFFRIQTFTGFIGVISTSLALMLLILQYAK
jgi:polysaccharide export outer membrane protein